MNDFLNRHSKPKQITDMEEIVFKEQLPQLLGPGPGNFKLF
jgi:hypothetical protein